MKRFRKIYVEITNICNMNCSFCPESSRAKATMSLENFKFVIDKIKDYTDYVYLHVKGEPLLHPNIKEILEICKENNLKINISTNGTLLKEKAKYLKDIRQLNVSLHSFEKEDEIKLKDYLKDTLTACNELSKEGVIVRYKLWNDTQSTKNNNVDIIKTLENWYNIQIKDLSYNKDIKLDENVFLSIKAPFKWPDIQDENNKESTCYGLRQQLAILVDGTVVPCCVDNNADINLGNIFETDLKEILDTQIAKDIKKGFEENKCIHPLCKKCEYRTYVT